MNRFMLLSCKKIYILTDTFLTVIFALFKALVFKMETSISNRDDVPSFFRVHIVLIHASIYVEYFARAGKRLYRMKIELMMV